jgi:hypothetical protein
MSIRRALAASGVLASLLGLAGCAGNGEALLGEVIDGGGGATCPPADVAGAPTLSAIQDTVFTPICSLCHVPGGPGPFRLDTLQQSYQNLVGVTSNCTLPSCAGLLRVAPCDPEGSYLIWKIEGRPGIEGGQMPLFLPPLEPEQIDAIRAWIEAGASP